MDNFDLQGVKARFGMPGSMNGPARPWGRENAAALKIFAGRSRKNRQFIVDSLRAFYKSEGVYDELMETFEYEAFRFLEGI